MKNIFIAALTFVLVQVNFITSTRADSYATLPGYDLYGGDIDWYRNSSSSSCETRCDNTSNCAAYTFNRRNNTCFIKYQFGEAQPFDGGTSRIRLPAAPIASTRIRSPDGELNMRAGPSTRNRILDTLYNTSPPLPIFACVTHQRGGPWCYVRGPRASGWMSAKYLDAQPLAPQRVAGSQQGSGSARSDPPCMGSAGEMLACAAIAAIVIGIFADSSSSSASSASSGGSSESWRESQRALEDHLCRTAGQC